MNKRTFILSATIGWSVTLAVLLLLPSDKLPDTQLVASDKLAHLGVFFIHSFLLNWAFHLYRLQNGKKIKVLLVSLTISIVYGAGLEFLQQFVPGRMTDIYDLLANTFGAVIGTIVFVTFSKISLRFLN